MMSDSSAFAGDPHISREIEKLIEKFDIRTIVETGTGNGDTSLELAKMAGLLVTVELDIEKYKTAHKKLEKVNNAMVIYGNSEEVLYEMMPAFEPPVLFYLDTHSENYIPVLNELNVISIYKEYNNSVIVIPHFYWPDSNLEYRSVMDIRLDMGCVRNYLYTINHKYQAYDNAKIKGSRCGVLYVHP
ncbi:MAG: hypothetical protein GY730_10235 [bacterium]|nr:hypothetical protein [bacterium]